jgi:hypothetical protein
MHAIRLHVGPAIEWGIAVAFLAATCAVGLLIVREFRTLRSPAPEIVTEPSPAVVPASVPPLAISVPALTVGEGVEIRIGDTINRVSDVIGKSGETGVQVTDRGRLGQRITRSYQRGGTRFIVVFEPFERQGVERVTAIYIQ